MRSTARVVSAVGLAIRLTSVAKTLTAVALITALAWVAGGATFSLPGSEAALLVHVAAGPLVAMVSTTVLVEDWHAYEASGSRHLWLVRATRWMASHLVLGVGLLALWVVAGHESSVVALGLLISATATASLSLIPFLWWLAPICLTYVVMINGWIVVTGPSPLVWCFIATLVVATAAAYLVGGSADARAERRTER